MQTITSTKNATYKYLKSLQQKKARTEHSVYTVEGEKSVLDAFHAGKKIEGIAIAESFSLPKVLSSLSVWQIPDSLFSGLCDTKTPQGILAVISMDPPECFLPKQDEIYIYCDHVADPGNAGTIIRTADAAGMSGVLFSPQSVDLYSPKVVRASMGSFFQIPTIPDFTPNQLCALKDDGFQILCAMLDSDTIEYTCIDFLKPSVIVLGNEANGVTPDVAALADKKIKIPILGAAESLNVGVAGAILMYEAVRQRKK